jgi:hypothetical protein
MANSIVIPVRRGDTVSRLITLKDVDDVAINLTGDVMRMNVKIDALDGVLTLTSGHGLTISAVDGEVTFVLTEDQTRKLYSGQKSAFELKRRTSSGQWTVLTGAFDVTEAIDPND